MGYVECSSPNCGTPVFASGLCRKHYEQARLETAAPCSVSGCGFKAYRGELCATHYRAHISSTHPICTIAGCSNHQKTLSSGLCEKHLQRSRKHGNTNQSRPTDWGAREAHPLYKSWTWHRRGLPDSMVPEWATDFWAFTTAVGAKPEGCTLRKLDQSRPLGPGNWDWKVSTSNKDKAAYQRVWRNANPDKARNTELKKSFGITLMQYDAMHDAQNGRCKICGELETAVGADGAPRRMPVDHCHKTGVVRGLLCTACNRALGLFKDSSTVLKNAVKYLAEFDVDTQKTQ